MRPEDFFTVEQTSAAHTFLELVERLKPYPFRLEGRPEGFLVLMRTDGKLVKALTDIDEAAEYVDTICDTAPEHWVSK